MRTNSDKSAQVFQVETQFQKLARREGGISRDKAIEQASSEVDRVKPGFDDWLTTELESLDGVIKGAKAGETTSDWAERANLHSRHLRDVGTTMGFTLLTFIAESLCEILDEIIAGAEYNMEAVVCHVDSMFLARQKPYRDLTPEQVPDLTDGLRRIAGRISAKPN